MALDQPRDPPLPRPRSDEKSCPRDVLAEALEGTIPVEIRLEALLDRLERRQ